MEWIYCTKLNDKNLRPKTPDTFAYNILIKVKSE